MAAPKKSVLFVCLGNICRSPMAEAVLRHMLQEQGKSGWTVDSCGIGPWHVGKSPDRRTLKVLKEHNIETNHRGRQLCKEDFTKFDYIFGMDEENMSDINERKPGNSTAKIGMLGSYGLGKDAVIEDPYYGDESGFDTTYEQVTICCKALIDSGDL